MPCQAGLVANGGSAPAAPAAFALGCKPVFALLCVAAQGAGVPRWSRTMATASRWVNPGPAEDA